MSLFLFRLVRVSFTLAAISALAFTGSLAARAQQKPIVIGASLSLSGIFADGGKYTLEGYQLWVDQQNAKGGLLGRPIELKYYDDQSDPATGIRLYEKLITEDHVDVIVGPYGTAITAPAASVAERYQMPMICPQTADVAMFRRGSKNIFQGLGPVQTYLYGVMEIAREHGLKKVAVIGGDTAFPHSLADVVPEIARGFGQSIVYQEYYPGKASDFSAVVQKTRAAEPDLVLAMAFPTDSIGLLRQLKQANYAPKMFYEAIGPSDPQFGTNAGKDADGVFSVTAWDPDEPTPANRAFISAYRSTFHRNPDYHSASSFSALSVVGAAIQKNGSLDKDKLRTSLATMSMPTLLGTYRVDPRTGIQLGYTSYIIQWQNGKQVVVYPRNVSRQKAIYPFPTWNAR
jgi:branched-chain amino acid transport system substrate-binding protein